MCDRRLILFLPLMALPTNGRVIIETTAGEIDIELWGKVGTISNQLVIIE